MTNQRASPVSDFRASGIAYAALRQAQAALNVTQEVEIPDYDHTKYESRLEVAKSLCKQYSSIGIGATADDDCKTLLIAFMAPVRKLHEEHASGLAAVVDRIRLDVPCEPGSQVNYTRKSAASADIHALKRLAMRAGKTSLREFGKALMPAWSWSGVADSIKIEGAYMVPVEDGLLCSERLKSSSSKQGEKEIWRTTIKTFIGKSELNKKNRDAWNYLRDSGCIRSVPHFPSLEAPLDPKQSAMMYQMRAEGRAWENRRDYAIKKISLEKGKTPEEQPNLSLF